VLAASGTNLFVATHFFLSSGGGSVFLSTNYGSSWTAVNTGLETNLNFNVLAVIGTNLFAGTRGPGTSGSASIWKRPLSQMITSVETFSTDLPSQFSLDQKYPNPFNPKTTINYSVSQVSFVTIKVYDVLGREVATIVNENKPVGNYRVEFDSGKLVSGIYFYRLQAGNFIQTKKMVLLK